MLQLLDETGDKRPRDERGRIVSRACPDRNCDGQLVYETDRYSVSSAGHWRCNGLTHHTDCGPLVACEHTHYDGEPVVGH